MKPNAHNQDSTPMAKKTKQKIIEFNPLQECRLNAGMTVEELAKSAAVASETIRRWESGAFMPSHENLWRVARVLKQKPKQLWSDLLEWKSKK